MIFLFMVSEGSFRLKNNSALAAIICEMIWKMDVFNVVSDIFSGYGFPATKCARISDATHAVG